MVVLMRIILHSLLVVLLVMLGGAPASLQDAPAPATRIIEISVERFSFTPSSIRVKAGTRLELRLRSEDTAHGFHIIGTDIDVQLPKRGQGTATVVFEPQVGRYTFECSQLCGAGHEFMRGVIIATD
jgi:cytochrome c oxidase subunit 2